MIKKGKYFTLLKIFILLSILLVYSSFSQAKVQINIPEDTTTFWHIYLGDSVKIKSNIIHADIAPDYYRMTIKKKSKKEDVIIFWGGCTPYSNRSVKIINENGRVVRKFYNEDSYKLKMVSSKIYRLPVGVYKMIWNRPHQEITLGILQIE